MIKSFISIFVETNGIEIKKIKMDEKKRERVRYSIPVRSFLTDGEYDLY